MAKPKFILTSDLVKVEPEPSQVLQAAPKEPEAVALSSSQKGEGDFDAHHASSKLLTSSREIPPLTLVENPPTHEDVPSVHKDQHVQKGLAQHTKNHPTQERGKPPKIGMEVERNVRADHASSSSFQRIDPSVHVPFQWDIPEAKTYKKHNSSPSFPERDRYEANAPYASREKNTPTNLQASDMFLRMRDANQPIVVRDQFNLKIDRDLKRDFRLMCLLREISMTEALEDAMRLYMEKMDRMER